MDIGLTALSEADIARHLPAAQSLVTRFTLSEAAPRESGVEIAGTRRRFVPTVSTSGLKSAREVEFAKTLASVTPQDTMMSPAQHNILYKTRRAIAVSLAVSDLFARQTGLDALHQRNASAVLQGAEADQFRALMEASAYVAAFSASAYIKQLVEGDGESTSDVAAPAFNFATPTDALKGFVAGLDAAA
ncbi:MAG TPA: AAA family ATPase, partial [Rhizobiaceae bacterium]|nr:AAA family ATPase [Rhizobiaceae bacterium]